MNTLPEMSSRYTEVYQARVLLHTQSFMEHLEIPELGPEDLRAAVTELRLSLALELNALCGLPREDQMLAWRQHECRIARSSPHACEGLLYKGVHGPCDHVGRYA